MDNQYFPKLTSSTPLSLDARDEVEAVPNNVGIIFFGAVVDATCLMTFGAGLGLGLNGIWAKG